MTVQRAGAGRVPPHTAARPGSPEPTPRRCCLTTEPYRVLGTNGSGPRRHSSCRIAGLRRLVRGRRYNAQATALTKQGRLAVYPSSTGQEACEVAARAGPARATTGSSPATATPSPWSRAASTRSRRCTLLRGDWHTGYDPREHRVAPLCTPLATQLPHAVGLRPRRSPQGRRRGRARLGRRRRHQRRRLPRGAELRRRLAGPGRLPRAEQRLRDLRAARQAERRRRRSPHKARRLRHARTPGRRQRRRRGARGARPRPYGTRRRAAARSWWRRVTYRDGRAHQRRRRHALPRATPRWRRGAEHDPIELLERELTERGLLDEDGMPSRRARTAETHGRRPARPR